MEEKLIKELNMLLAVLINKYPFKEFTLTFEEYEKYMNENKILECSKNIEDKTLTYRESKLI